MKTQLLAVLAITLGLLWLIDRPKSPAPAQKVEAVMKKSVAPPPVEKIDTSLLVDFNPKSSLKQ